MPDVFRIRDFIALGVIVLAILHCYYEPLNYDYHIEPIWFVEYADSHPEEHKKGHKNHIVTPLVYDFNKDGRNELVSVGSDSILRVSNIGKEMPNSISHIIHAEELFQADLDFMSGKPLAIGVGCCYRSPNPDSVYPPNHNFIVVVNDFLDVIAYNSELDKVWQSSLNYGLKEEVHQNCGISANVRIVPDTNVNNQERSIVVIAANFMKKSVLTDHAHDSYKCPSELQIFGLDSQSGQPLWNYKEESDGTVQSKDEFESFLPMTLPKHGFSSDLRRDLYAHQKKVVSGNDWKHFRTSVFQELPHYWRDIGDNQLKLSHFEKTHFGTFFHHNRNHVPTSSNGKKGKSFQKRSKSSSSGKKDKKSLLKLGSIGNVTLAKMLGKTPEGSESKEVKKKKVHKYNVLVYHYMKGIRVLALQNGKPIVSLPLDQNAQYGDVNHDGTLDSVHFASYSITHADGNVLVDRVNGSSAQKTVNHMCEVSVLSGIPPHSLLFNDSTVCDGEHAYRRYNAHGRSKAKRAQKKRLQALQEAAANVKSTPLIVSYRTRHTPPHPEFMSATTTISYAATRDARTKDLPVLIVATNIGLVNAYTARGSLAWQLSESHIDSHIPDDEFELKLSQRHPLLTQFNQLVDHRAVGDKKYGDNILYVSDKKMKLISLDGNVLVETLLPNPLIAKPIIHDFDSNGVNDLILMTEVAIIGYRIHIFPAFYPLIIPLLVIAVVAIVIFVSKIRFDTSNAPIRSSGNPILDDKKEVNTKGKKLSFFDKKWSLIRSTDSHLD